MSIIGYVYSINILAINKYWLINFTLKILSSVFNLFLIKSGIGVLSFNESAICCIPPIPLSGNIGIYQMPNYTCFEIDEKVDWIIAESIMKNYVLK